MSTDTDRIDFDRYNSRQIAALSNVAFGGDGKQCAPATLTALHQDGLIEPVEAIDTNGLPVRWTRWEMPLAVHIQFCAWGATQPD